MRAKGYRILGLDSRYKEAMSVARQLGATRRQLEAEELLGKIQTGEIFEQAERYISTLSAAGASPNDIASALVMGCFEQGQLARAAVMLDGWAADLPDQAQTSYVRGLYWKRVNNLPEAEKLFRQSLELEPRHELAEVALASLLQREGRLDDDLARFQQLASRFPHNQETLVGLSRALRTRARIEEARSVLEAAAADAEPTSHVAFEMGQIELEAGEYAEANRWLKRVDATTVSTGEGLSISVIALALSGNTTAAKWTNDRVVEAATIVRKSQDLRARLATQPDDRQAALELRSLLQTLAAKYSDTNPFQLPTTAFEAKDPDARPGMQLYQRHCADCHGENGDGEGRASQYFYPLPRNLRHERYRLVSSLNGIPTLDDLKRVIREGVPGTSMVANEELSDQQLTQLAEIVLSMRREGVKEQAAARLRSMGEQVDDQELDAIAVSLTTAGDIATAPPFPDPTPESIARGRKLYVKHACQSCHGENGEGDEVLPMFDDRGMPVAPRHLGSGGFRGGDDPADLYRRIIIGMPGSPHPASAMTDDEATDLVHFVLSLRQPPSAPLTNHQRAVEAMSRPVLE
jgi:cytochrome c/Tfp pilus assembly protein PilF